MVRCVVGDDTVRPELADVERHGATDLRVQSGRYHPGRDSIGSCDHVPHLFRSRGHLIGALHPVFDTVGLVGIGHEGSSGRGYDETVRRCGRPSSWWYRATSTATADCRSVANAARSSGDLNPITVSTVRVSRHVPVAALLAIAPTSDTVRAFTAIRYAAERRSATSFGSMAALCNTSGATTRWRAERRTNRSVIPPHRASRPTRPARGPPTPSSDSSPSDGSTRPPPQPWQPTPVQSARRGSRPGSDRAPLPRRQRQRALERRPRTSR